MRQFPISLLVAILITACRHGTPAPQREARTFYVDCGAGNDAGSGETEQTAWRSTRRVNEEEFVAGDRILFRRGGRCAGHLAPQGSGTPKRPIGMGAWGAGARPVIDGGSNREVLLLSDQQGWEVENLEFTGGSINGVSVTGSGRGVLRHFRFRNLYIHGVTGGGRSKRFGGLSIAPSTDGLTFADILIDGVEVSDSKQWSGIVVDGGYPPLRLDEMSSTWERYWYRWRRPPHTFAENVVVRNSIVHDIAGDPIVLFRVRGGVIENNVAWRGGMQESKRTEGQNPNAMWVLLCEDCQVRGNQAFWMDTPGVDGGAFDIDWGCKRSVLEDNYAHDNQGYCLSLFGARGMRTSDSLIRRNVCIGNGRSPRLATRQGDLFLSVWDGGSLGAFDIHDNVFVWEPPLAVPLIRYQDWGGSRGEKEKRPQLIRHNFVRSSAPLMEGEGEDFVVVDNEVGTRSMAGGPELAVRFGLGGLSRERGTVRMRVRLHPGGDPQARRLANAARAALEQYGAIGLTVQFRVAPDAPAELEHDWGVSVPMAVREASDAAVELADGGGRIIRRWGQAPGAAELGLTLRRVMGDPPGTTHMAWALADVPRKP